MIRKLSNLSNICVVFDLDDTLYKEIDFVKSAFHAIAKDIFHDFKPEKIYNILYNTYLKRGDAFEEIIVRTQYFTTKEKLLYFYRNHVPSLILSEDVKLFLEFLKKNNVTMGIISDGRSLTQRNKIKSLKLYKYILNENIIISEEFGFAKPSAENFVYFMKKYPNIKKFLYFGDNIKKDFIMPNSLGWTTIGLRDKGQNIHSQNIEICMPNWLPNFWINDMVEAKTVLKSLFNLYN